jgi:hypothetical protein
MTRKVSTFPSTNSAWIELGLIIVGGAIIELIENIT